MLLWSQHAFVIFIFSSIIYTYYFSATLRNSTLTKQGKQNRQIVMMIHVIIEWPILEIIIVFNDLKSIYRTLKQYMIGCYTCNDYIIIINWYIYNIVVKLTFFNIYFILHFSFIMKWFILSACKRCFMLKHFSFWFFNIKLKELLFDQLIFSMSLYLIYSKAYYFFQS